MDAMTETTTIKGAIIVKQTASPTNIIELQDTAGNIIASIKSTGGIIINEQGADSDTRIEGDTEPNLLLIDASADAVLIGDGATHYTKLNKLGHQTMTGNARAWRDELGELLGKKKLGQRITDDLAEGTVVFTNACQIADDYIILNVQLNHDKDIAGAIHAHLHWFQAAATVPNWLIQSRWQSNGTAKVTAWSPLKYSALVYPYDSGTITQIASFPAISPPAGSGLSDIVQFRIARDTDNDSGLFAGAEVGQGTVHALMFDIHFQTNSLGSDDEYTK